MSPPDIDRLVAAVQTNCHIADAQGAADLTLCIYLLQMRELYRWEHGIALLQPLPREDVARWLAAREALWAELETRQFVPLPLAGQDFDPFDVTGINEHLQPWGWVYGAGQVAPGRASFFLGRLQRQEARGGIELLVCGDELARGLAAPVAALQGATVWLREQSLRRWLAEKYEAWTLKRQAGAFKSALDAHGYQRDGEQALQHMAREQSETLVLHELGEYEAGRRLGPDWQALRAALPSRRAELYVRALRDHLADCLVTLPVLLQRRDPGSLHFWFANLEGVRALLFPQLERAYGEWCGGDEGVALHAAVSAGRTHWLRACERMLAIHRAHGNAAPAHIERCLQSADCVLG